MVVFNRIAEITNEIENNNNKGYIYNHNKFRYIDNSKKINFEMNITNNCLYLKDNDFTYIYSEKELDDNTVVKQVILEDDTEKVYCSILERDGLWEIGRMYLKNEFDVVKIENSMVIGKSDEEIIDYADEIFADCDDEEDEYEYEEEYEADNDAKCDDEYEDEQENDFFGIKEDIELIQNISENGMLAKILMDINDYSDVIEENDELLQEELEELEECEEITVKLNDKELEGKDKLKIMSLYKETAEYRYFGSIFNDAGIYELLDVLKEKEMQCNNFSFSKDRD